MSKHDIITEIKTMPGMYAQFTHGFDRSTKYQRIFSDCVVNWMQEHGLIEHILGTDTTPPAFLCSPRKLTNVQVSDLGMQVIAEIRGDCRACEGDRVLSDPLRECNYCGEL